MEGINTHTEMYGTGTDPNIITLGPEVGGHPKSDPYSNKTSMEFELKHGVPVLAPIDMVFIGFKNSNAKYRIRLVDGSSANQLPDGQNKLYIAPFNDLLLCFESSSPDWPGMIICTYHLFTSPLLLGHNQSPDCGEVEEWGSTEQMQGHMFGPNKDKIMDPTGDALSCDALIGHSIKRGEVIGFAGSVGSYPLEEKIEGEYITVGTHSMAPFRFKVSHTSENPTVQEGAIFIGFSQAHSYIGNVITLARNSPVGYLLILSNVEVINFQQNNTM